MNDNKNGISRKNFLKTSGIMLGGMAILPNYGCLGDLISNDKLRIEGRTDYAIVVSNKANSTEREAAEQLQQYLSKMSKIALPLVEEGDYSGKNALYVGQTDYAKAQDIDFDRLKKDGYTFKVTGNNFVIAGGAEKGVLYGVYSLLESIGFRKYTSDDDVVVPKGNEVVLPKNDIFVPYIKYRTTSYYDAKNPEYSNWHKLSSRDTWGMFVHTFEVLIPPKKYGKTHPEYYSLINGKRNPVTQLCLSNEEVFKTLVAELRKRIAKDPKATYWSVSQNDNDKYCQCGPCTKLNEKYGGVPSGSVIWFTNKVAREFPDKVISTLAYWYTRSAPSNIKIEPNVNIMLCNIESTREKPVFDTDPAFTSDLQDWGKISQDILIWDYNIQFANPVSPFPNLHTIGPNIEFYTKNNVRSLFMQATSNKGEFAHLRAYLICKLMWDPDADPGAIIDDFLNGYYGAAGPFIGQYIDTMRQSLLDSDFKLNIFGDPRDAMDNYLSADMMTKYKQLFDKAEDAVGKDPQLLKRVQVARLPLMHAEIQIAGQVPIDMPRSFYEYTSSGMVIPKPEMEALVSQFVERAKEAGVARIGERAITIDDYFENFKRIYARMDDMDKAISFKKKIIPITTPSKGSASVERLTDGVFGSFESWRFPDKDVNWVAYKGVHMDFVLDLGEVMPVESISMDFLNVQAQPNWHLLVLPKYVTYAASLDGKKYGSTIKITNPQNPNPAVNPDIVKVPFQSFSARLDGTKARYIKVHAESPLRMPTWHINAGKPAAIYSDEIVVK
ncbi:DUF4838 domain-containing protein [Flavobacteriaceae bacterium F89]|uniref:DUF4838 domain-containing protein n=1 Tax=Cerina litoralis TaxID=2874477 RepID=A0AAE3EZ57_9FLAO|nr:DUF4838 domain-containing protein [Cerina litoralis]MCG2462306.1 DUF4838 domain-containing protein [Cerina litoralis]